MRKTFDGLLAEVIPFVYANCPDGVTVGGARIIAEDIAYLISRGYTIEMAKAKPEDRRKIANEQMIKFPTP